MRYNFFVQRFFTLLILFFFSGVISAQNAGDTSGLTSVDSVISKINIPARDTVKKQIPVKTDSVSLRPVKNLEWAISPAVSILSSGFCWEVLKRHPYYGFSSPTDVFRGDAQKRVIKGKEIIFYLIVFLLLILALLRNAFSKYFVDLFRVFFRTTLKQKQVSEQLIQTPLPSLLLNGFYVVTAGLYLSFIFEFFKQNPLNNFWLLFLYCSTALSLIYLVKFIGLKIAGWLFSMPEAADSYVFIVFVINKMIGIILLPFLVILAFTSGGILQTGLTLSFILIGLMLFYRVILTFAAVRNHVRVNPFHFFLYLCAFEVAPLLVIGKVVLEFLSISA